MTNRRAGNKRKSPTVLEVKHARIRAQAEMYFRLGLTTREVARKINVNRNTLLSVIDGNIEILKLLKISRLKRKWLRGGMSQEHFDSIVVKLSVEDLIAVYDTSARDK